MTELKPCPFCGAGKDCPPEVGDDDFVSCRYCGARASFDRWDDRPAPELPEGYRVEDGEFLVAPTGWVLGRKRSDGFHVSGGHYYPEDAHALTIWLQRRVR